MDENFVPQGVSFPEGYEAILSIPYDEDDLAELSKRLFDAGVLPYYLHLLDPVAGAAHFDVAPARGRALVAGLRRRLPGYLVPRLAREAPGESSKTILA